MSDEVVEEVLIDTDENINAVIHGIKKLNMRRGNDGDADAGRTEAFFCVGGNHLDMFPDICVQGFGVHDVKNGLILSQCYVHGLPLSARPADSAAS